MRFPDRSPPAVYGHAPPLTICARSGRGEYKTELPRSITRYVLARRPGRRAASERMLSSACSATGPVPRTVSRAGPLGYDPREGAEGRRSGRDRSASRKTPRRAPTMSTSRAHGLCRPAPVARPRGAAAGADEADLILQHGKVVTVDRDFSVRRPWPSRATACSASGPTRRSSRPAGRARQSSISAARRSCRA